MLQNTFGRSSGPHDFFLFMFNSIDTMPLYEIKFLSCGPETVQSDNLAMFDLEKNY